MTWFSRILRWGPYEDLAGWLRGLGIAVAAAIFMAWVGAFTSTRAGMPARLIYWFSLMLLGWVWGSFVARIVIRGLTRPRNTWLRVIIASLAISIPYSAVVAFVSAQLFGASFELSDIPELVGSVTMVALVVTALNVLVESRAEAGATRASAEPAKFLERLPIKLRGAEVWAVEAEDHYLRLHTSKGQDLILMRLADAVSELQGIEGAQVHRSWWVARDAIADARRGDGRATLTLKDGAEAPVSRTYARLLRERGWI
jgi:hypothetical protein